MENPIKNGWFGGTTIFGNILMGSKRGRDLMKNLSVSSQTVLTIITVASSSKGSEAP